MSARGSGALKIAPLDRDGFDLLGIKLDVLDLPDLIAGMMSAGSLGRPARSGRLYLLLAT
jgi:hypothetical protein